MGGGGGCLVAETLYYGILVIDGCLYSRVYSITLKNYSDKSQSLYKSSSDLLSQVTMRRE